MEKDLYEENKGLLRMMAQRYARVCALDRAVSVEDLMQVGFVGLMKAASTYDPAAGKSWAGWARWHIRNEFEKTLGMRHGVFIRANAGAISLDKPISSDDPDGLTVADTIEDEKASDVGADLIQDERSQEVHLAVLRLKSKQQREVITMHLAGLSSKEIASTLNMTINMVYQTRHRAISRLKHDARLKEYFVG